KADEALKAAEIALKQGASFIDINCACPIDEVIKKGLGAAMLQRPKRIVEIVESLSKNLAVPITVKLRIGWDEEHINIAEVAKMLEAAGATALIIHGRTRAQRYTKAANWELIKSVAADLSIPVLGNGDILTWYEAEDRKVQSGVLGVVLARGALISPWLFSEIKNGGSKEITPKERVSVYFKLSSYMKEHFGDDELGRRRIMSFLPWHFDFFCRYRHFPMAEYRSLANEYPLMQRREEKLVYSHNLERVLACTEEILHGMIASELLDSTCDDEAAQRVEALIWKVPDIGKDAEAPMPEES
ncbi:MAG: tRNA-dihydrouridine synthase family protein, partial [SAR324 cluster bacterium]|nr:tRNA-dihydrouridine synthase family protein [SAR324 cluster bacterium]